MNKQGLVALTAAILLQACSTASKDLTPSYVSPLQYQSYDCAQIAPEAQRLQTRIVALGGRLDEAAANDKSLVGVGMILFWPALFALGGTKTQEAEFSRLKGEYDALQQTALVKKCQPDGIVVAAPLPAVPLAASTSAAPTTAATASVAPIVAAPTGAMSTAAAATTALLPAAQPVAPVLAPVADDPGPHAGVAEKKLAALADLHKKGLISDGELKTRRDALIDEVVANAAGTASVAKKSAPQAAALQTMASPSTGLRPGDRLRFVERDGYSKVAVGESILNIYKVDPERVSYNGGAIVLRRDGTAESGQAAGSYIYQYGGAERSTSAKFKVESLSEVVPIQLKFIGTTTLSVSGILIPVNKFAFSGRASYEKAPGGDMTAKPAIGADISGEMFIDTATGLTILIRSVSRHTGYSFERELVAIAR